VTPRSVRDQTGQVVPIRTGEDEVHIVADVAWAACCYADWSGDTQFAASRGHQLLVETAQYWASRIRVESDGAHVYGVIGPDEYHEPVDDNMFTNVMARWNLRRAAASARAHGGVDAEEVSRWLDLADRLVDGYDPDTGLYEQFAGFDKLESVLIAEIAPRRPIAADLLLGRDRVRGAQVIKQPDVLMAQHLVPDECADGSLVPNLDFYEPRTAHGSSLSPGVHASLLARARRFDDALHWLRIAADVDLADITNTTAAGLHLATMGSVWQAFAFGFAGLRAGNDALTVDPRVPDAWDELELAVRYHDVPVRVLVRADSTTITADQPIELAFGPARSPIPCGPGSVTVEHER
jgi:trehalose/maltose hydrolase-like predicted phosphorylase